jgi:hypothetical protein
MQLHIEI